jgi:hypothetical protein
MRSGLAMLEGALGEEHPSVHGSLQDLGYLLLLARKPAEADPLFRRCLLLQRARAETPPQSIAATLHGLGAALYDLGRPEDAEAVLREGQTILATAEPPDPILAAFLDAELGSVLAASHRVKEAEALLARSCSALREPPRQYSFYRWAALQRFLGRQEATGPPVHLISRGHSHE